MLGVWRSSATASPNWADRAPMFDPMPTRASAMTKARAKRERRGYNGVLDRGGQRLRCAQFEALAGESLGIYESTQTTETTAMSMKPSSGRVRRQTACHRSERKTTTDAVLASRQAGWPRGSSRCLPVCGRLQSRLYSNPATRIHCSGLEGFRISSRDRIRWYRASGATDFCRGRCDARRIVSACPRGGHDTIKNLGGASKPRPGPSTFAPSVAAPQAQNCSFAADARLPVAEASYLAGNAYLPAVARMFTRHVGRRILMHPAGLWGRFQGRLFRGRLLERH